MVEKEPRSTRQKLTEAAALDYPSACEIMVSFPGKWELVRRMQRGETPLYIGAIPTEDETPRPDRFHDLTTKINLDLTSYRMFKLFLPWPMPSVIASWKEEAHEGRVEGMGDLRVHLQPIGQAQAYFGRDFGVLWECFLYEQTRKEGDWQTELNTFWRTVEGEMDVAEIFTLGRDPAFLQALGYAPDPDFGGWWSKWSGEG
jgi:hypothetical protein